MARMGLDGFVVIDFTTKEAGPICSEYLGLLGMKVIRVDHPSATAMSKNDQYYFVADNLNKKCVTIDYDTAEGKAQLFSLIASADVLIENRPFGFMESLGCGYDEIKKVNSKIVYCAIKPYTKDSPWADAAWNPTTVDAMGGSTYLTGYVGGIPVEPGPQLSDLSTCGYAATGIMAALYQREETGAGQYIEASMQDAIVAHARSAYEKFSLNGIVTRVGNNFPTLPDMVPMSLFHTKGEGPEDWAMIGCMGDKMVEILCETMGKPELITDPRFDTFDHRLENKDEMLKIIQDYALGYEKNDLMEHLLGEKRLVCAAVCTTKDVVESDDLKNIGFVHTIKDEALGDMNLPGCAGVFHGVESVPVISPGRPGDANEEVLGNLAVKSDANEEVLGAQMRNLSDTEGNPSAAHGETSKDPTQTGMSGGITGMSGSETGSDLLQLYKGLTIVEATLAESGPVCGQTFAMLGADVIHIERPADEPDKRYVGHIVRQNNKKSVTLDTKTEEGKEIMWKMLEKADVFLENFAPGAWDRMGFSYEEVKKRNPNIVYMSIKGFAKNTRFEKCITYDPVACCSGGGTFLSGLEDGDPMLCGINVGDSGSAIIASHLLAAAILRKKVTGEGCFVEAPMQNAVVSQSRQSFAEYYANDGKVRRAGNSYRGLEPTAPWNLYPCQGNDVTGNYVVICCSADPESKDFEKLCGAMGREDLLTDARYATPALRFENRHALDFEISKWTVTLPKRTLIQKLAVELQIPAGAVLGPADIVRPAESKRRSGDKFGPTKGIIRWMDAEGDEYVKNRAGKPMPGVFMPTLPLRFETGDIKPIFPGRYDHCNKEIYHDWLGLSEEELTALKAKHVI